MSNSATLAGVPEPVESLLLSRIRSRVYGRERWEVPGILGRARAAASVKALLESEWGIRHVVANELTGRVLVEYVPGELTDSVERLLRRALEFGPMSASEFNALREPKPRALPIVGAFASAELGCFFLKLVLLGGGCPALGAAVCMIGLAAAFVAPGRPSTVVPRIARTGGIESDEARGISDDENRAQIVQNGGDDGIDGADGREIQAN